MHDRPDSTLVFLVRVSEVYTYCRVRRNEHVTLSIKGGDQREAASYDGDGGDVRGRERDRGGGRAEAAKEIQAAHAQEDQVGRGGLQRQGK